MKQNVNYIEHQRNVFDKLLEDQNIRTSHLSIYNALFMIWNNCFFETELSINRNDVMKLSKIGNANTYTSCLKDLDKLGYIIYKPSFNPLKGSLVTIIRYDKASDKGTDKASVKGGSKGTDNGTGEGSDTLYKLLNSKTLKLLNNNIQLVNDNLENWINSYQEIKIEFPFDSDFFLEQWDLWKKFKKEEFKFNYKSKTSEQAALVDLNKKANGNEDVAIKIIHQSIANGWKGFFELKNNNTNGKAKSFTQQANEYLRANDPDYKNY